MKYFCAALLAALALVGWLYDSSRIELSLTKTALATAENANKTTTETLERIAGDVREIGEKTSDLSKDILSLSAATQRGILSVRKEVASAKTVTLSDPLPRDIAVSLCLQHHTANSGNALHGEALPGAVLFVPSDAFAKQCAAAWKRVTWGDVVEWLIPLMEHDGKLQRQLDAGRAYYTPKVNAGGNVE